MDAFLKHVLAVREAEQAEALVKTKFVANRAAQRLSEHHAAVRRANGAKSGGRPPTPPEKVARALERYRTGTLTQVEAAASVGISVNVLQKALRGAA